MQNTLLLPSHIVRSCRLVAGRRYSPAWSVTSRAFQSSASRPTPPQPSSEANDSANDSANVNLDTPAASVDPVDPNAQLAEHHHDSVNTGQSSNGRKTYMSGLRRTLKDKKSSSDAPPAAATIPQWFIDKNVVTNSPSVDKASPAHVQERQHSSNHTASNSTTPTPRPSNDSVSSPAELSAPQECDHLEDQSQKPGSGPDKPTHIDHRYAINPDVWLRLQLAVRAGFATPSAKYAHDPATEKSHLLLQYPHRRDEASVDTIGSSVFLHAVVQRLAREEEADLLILNAQDIARLCSDQVRAEGKTSSSIQNLGYEIYNTWNKRRRTDLESSLEKEDGLNDNSETSISLSGTNSRPHILPIEVTLPDTQLPDWLLSSFGASTEGSASRISRSETGAWMRVIDQLLSQPTPRASGDKTSTPQTETDLKFDTSRKEIVHIQDYVELMQSREGSKFLKLLLDAIHSRRRSGRRILLIGTSSSYKDTFLDRETSLSPIAEQARLYLDSSARPFTSPIAVFPSMQPKDLNSKFSEDRSARIRCINIRHLQDMLRLRVNTDKIPIDDKIFDSASWPGDIDDGSPLGALNTDYLGYTRVHNLASMIMGAVSSNETLSFEHIRQAFVAETMHRKSFERWHSPRAAGTANWTPGAGSNEPEFEGDFRPSKLDSIVQSECNKYEKKLLGGVVNAGNIRTTFADVHVPPETVEALKTLTSLSLKRPDAFTYGVLASDKIPGMLLYGPPGTGKTLLAKAVARESGATVLEVSGSDIYDMYVGEGEKNVKAIFTLARKLSPCVVFIDEADAIFGSRNQSRNRFSSHRELINQFLREWDGMNDMSAFIMVATNRPFDLDDAVLRRLPRRLLVDLPVEQDREAILKIHLKNEQLDSSVNLADLAKRTPFYSGSDLKNACVAAALTCVREEYEKKTQHTGDDTYQYPERRTLNGDHFERALEEISASISEDMSSLDEIRKFDEKFGDRKARRKKKPSWGFAPLTDTQTPTDTTRVRT